MNIFFNANKGMLPIAEKSLEQIAQDSARGEGQFAPRKQRVEDNNSPAHTVFLALGSNLGDRQAQLQQAVMLLGQYVTIELISLVYDTAPMLVTDQPRFLNIVCSASTTLSPMEVLLACKSIEEQLGRVPGPRYGPRTIDIDLLFYDDMVLETPSLTLPHPHIAERAFVLLPLAEIVPTLFHPVLHATVATLAEAVADADVQKDGSLFSPTA